MAELLDVTRMHAGALQVRRERIDLVRLLGAPHLPPYTDMEPQLGIVERVTIDFLRYYLEGRPGALKRMAAAATVPGTATLTAHPPVS